MYRVESNKRFILNYIRALNEAEDKLKILSRYTSDSALIERIAFLEKAFPQHQVMVDEVTAEARCEEFKKIFHKKPENHEKIDVASDAGAAVFSHAEL